MGIPRIAPKQAESRAIRLFSIINWILIAFVFIPLLRNSKYSSNLFSISFLIAKDPRITVNTKTGIWLKKDGTVRIGVS